MSKFWKTRKIYVSIISAGYPWRELIDEANSLKLKEMALFLTGILEKERAELYQKLEKPSIKSIPFVHLRSEEKPEEIEYLIKKFGTKKFNLHSEEEFPIIYDLSRYYDKIYLENTEPIFKDSELKKFAGICVDVAHLEASKHFLPEKYKIDRKMMKKYRIGCNHISPFKKDMYEKYSKTKNAEHMKGSHTLENLKELDYLKNYPSYIFSNTIALEMQNTIKEQLNAKEYIINLLRDKE